MAFMKIFTLILFSGLVTTANSDILGTAFEPGSQHQRPIFNYRENSPDNKKNFQIKGTYTGLDGAELVVEQLEVKEGRIARYSVDHRQLKENGTMEVKDGKLNFSYTAGGKTKTNTEDAPANLVVGLSLVSFIEAHWSEILQGESFSFRYAVLDRQETVGFKVFKTEEGRRGDTPTTTIKMKPTSFVIAALVDPVLLTFSTKDRELLEIIGRTLPKRSGKGGWEALDPEMIFKKENSS